MNGTRQVCLYSRPQMFPLPAFLSTKDWVRCCKGSTSPWAPHKIQHIGACNYAPRRYPEVAVPRLEVVFLPEPDPGAMSLWVHFRIGSPRRKLEAFLAAERENGIIAAKNAREAPCGMPEIPCGTQPIDCLFTLLEERGCNRAMTTPRGPWREAEPYLAVKIEYLE